MTTSDTTAAEATKPGAGTALPGADLASADLASDLASDPREQITYGVMMAGGRLAPRSFASRQEAQEWARNDEQVVAWNYVCDCDM